MAALSQAIYVTLPELALPLIQDRTPEPRHTNPYNLRRSKPRTEIQCPNIKFELEKGLEVLEFNDPVR